MQEFISTIEFTILEIVGLSLLIVFLVIQLFFYLKYYRKPLKSILESGENQNGDASNQNNIDAKPKVSIIIEAENEVANLMDNLPMILEQDYPNFEVIIINNGSTDETYELLESLKLKYSNIYHTHVPMSNDKEFGRRKLAFTLGIKAAKGDVLLFTESYSRPDSNKWISEMIKHISDKTEVVLGYSYYTKSSRFFNRVARFDNHLFSMQYLSMALENKPFTGVYRNLAFKKRLFFDNKGFSSFLSLENGEDAFINQIATPENTAIAISKDSFVSTTINSYSLWRRFKKSYSVAKTFFKDKNASFFGLEYFSRFAFYASWIAIIVNSCLMAHWAPLVLAIIIFLIRFFVQFSVIKKGSKYFNSGKFCLSLIPMDILQPIYNIAFRTRLHLIKGRR